MKVETIDLGSYTDVIMVKKCTDGRTFTPEKGSIKTMFKCDLALYPLGNNMYQVVKDRFVKPGRRIVYISPEDLFLEHL